jgi:hypothetical protein
MIIVPSTAVETMGLGAIGGLTAFDRIMGESQAGAEGTKPMEGKIKGMARDAKERKVSKEVQDRKK